MKTFLNLLALLALLAILLAPSHAVDAKASRIDFTVVETCNDDMLMEKAMQAGPNFHAFGLTQTCNEDGSIPQATGTAYLSDGKLHVVGGNVIANGSCRIETVEGGVWQGRWTMSAGVFEFVGHGEGIYAGMQYFSISNQNGKSKGYILIP